MGKRRPLRVLLVCGSLPPMLCGVGDYTARLGRTLADAGATEVAVLTSRHDGRSDAAAELAGFDVLEPISRWVVSSLGPALSAIRSWKPDIVHIQHPAQGYDGTLPFVLGPVVRWHLKLPVVVTLHEPAGVNRHLPGMTTLVRSANATVVTRPNFRALLPRGLRWITAGKELCLIPVATTLPRVERTPDLIRTVRQRYDIKNKSIVAYFGFVYSNRGVHQLFRIADPKQHHLVIVGGKLDEAAQYHDEVTRLARQGNWNGACTMTGFLSEEQAAAVLASADAVVLPFIEGGRVGGSTSMLGARLQGTFVLTTSSKAQGYDSERNIYYARPGDIDEMQEALVKHLGTRQPPRDVPTWEQVAARHIELYAQVRL